jgi:hypothetical protein
MAIASWIPCCNHIGNSCKDFKLTTGRGHENLMGTDDTEVLAQPSVCPRRQPELADDNDPLSPSMNTRVMRSLKVRLVPRTG